MFNFHTWAIYYLDFLFFLFVCVSQSTQRAEWIIIVCACAPNKSNQNRLNGLGASKQYVWNWLAEDAVMDVAAEIQEIALNSTTVAGAMRFLLGFLFY